MLMKIDVRDDWQGASQYWNQQHECMTLHLLDRRFGLPYHILLVAVDVT